MKAIGSRSLITWCGKSSQNKNTSLQTYESVDLSTVDHIWGVYACFSYCLFGNAHPSIHDLRPFNNTFQ